MNGWMGEWTDGQTNGQISQWKDERMDGDWIKSPEEYLVVVRFLSKDFRSQVERGSTDCLCQVLYMRKYPT